jgi:hypothetical protein
MRKSVPGLRPLGMRRICRSHSPDHVVKSNKDDHSNAECWRRPDREIDGIELVSEAFNIGFHWFPPGELSGIETVWRTDHPLPSKRDLQGSLRARGAGSTPWQHEQVPPYSPSAAEKALRPYGVDR